MPENTVPVVTSELEEALAKIDISETQNENTPNQVHPIETNSIVDININECEDIFRILIQKEYDFVTIEAGDTQVKLSFKKNDVEQEVKYIKYPIYSKILIKAKILTHLDVNETEKIQE